MDFNKLIGENLAKPRGLFGKIVGFFMDIRNKSINKWTIDLMEINPSDQVLEIGYGTGATIKSISTVAKCGLTVGIDYSETMFRKASRVNAKAIYKGSVTLITGDASNILIRMNTLTKYVRFIVFTFGQSQKKYLEKPGVYCVMAGK